MRELLPINERPKVLAKARRTLSSFGIREGDILELIPLLTDVPAEAEFFLAAAALSVSAKDFKLYLFEE